MNTRAIIVIVLSKVNISTKQTEESLADKISRAGVTLVKLDQDKDSFSFYLNGRRRIHGDRGESPVLGGVDHGVVSQQVHVGLGLLQLNLGDGGSVLGHRAVVGVRVEDAVGVGAGGAGVGHADGPSGGGGRARLVVRLVPTGDADGQRSHPALAIGPIGPLLPGRRHQGGRRQQLGVLLGHERLEVDPDTGAGEPQGTSAT